MDETYSAKDPELPPFEAMEPSVFASQRREPFEIRVADLLRSGCIGTLQLGMNRVQVVGALGEPSDAFSDTATGKDSSGERSRNEPDWQECGIWFYGDLIVGFSGNVISSLQLCALGRGFPPYVQITDLEIKYGLKMEVLLDFMKATGIDYRLEITEYKSFAHPGGKVSLGSIYSPGAVIAVEEGFVITISVGV